ncbi:MAG TPA: patatin-like phospholipase family protein [Verrucomicrobiae bacterium]|nr:patatin-like phospholipase family protein [Verrucomicrobiae bacterium]
MQIRDTSTRQKETVLVMQGGGSLGAYECGIYKTLEKHNIKLDIVAGTSIGAINASIIAGSKGQSPAKTLEEFWMEIAEKIIPSFLSDNLRSIFSSIFASCYGNKNIFEPIWYSPNTFKYNSLFYNYTNFPPHLYDIKPLKDTLSKFIDFDKINYYYKTNITNKSKQKKDAVRFTPRLIMSSTDIQKSEPVTFDSDTMKIDADHIVACAGFPFYGLSWTEKDGRYLWDGSLLSNTPLREVINASPKNHKIVYIVNLFPKNQKEVPKNMFEIWHRARDIMHTDRTEHNIHMSKIISKHLEVMKDMHDLLNNIKIEENMKDLFFKIEKEYHKLATDRGTIIKEIIKIEREEEKEKTHFIFEDADFSVKTIQQLIKQGEDDAEKALQINRKSHI